VVEDGEFYSVYFSQGVLLEVQLIAARLGAPGIRSAVVPAGSCRWFREGDIGQAARGAACRRCLPNPGRSWTARSRKGDAASEVVQALQDIRHGDTLVLWLAFGGPGGAALAPEPAVTVVLSSSGRDGLARRTPPLPAAWRKLARMAYPYELPELAQPSL